MNRWGQHHLAALELRRLALLQRCEEQRLELAYRFAQIRPSAQLTAWRRRGGPRAAAGKPLTWIAAIAGLALLLRTRPLLTKMTWVTGLAALATRTTTLLRVIAQLRALYAGFQAARSYAGARHRHRTEHPRP